MPVTLVFTSETMTCAMVRVPLATFRTKSLESVTPVPSTATPVIRTGNVQPVASLLTSVYSLMGLCVACLGSVTLKTKQQFVLSALWGALPAFLWSTAFPANLAHICFQTKPVLESAQRDTTNLVSPLLAGHVPSTASPALRKGSASAAQLLISDYFLPTLPAA